MNTNARTPLWLAGSLLGALTLVLIAILGGAGIIGRAEPGGMEETLGTLYCDTYGLPEGGEAEMNFFLDHPEADLDISLYMDGRRISGMEFNEIPGYTAGGGVEVYVCTVTVKGGKDGEKHEFYAASGNDRSSIITVYSFDEVTDADEEEAREYSERIDAIAAEYTDSDGIVYDGKKTDALKAVEAAVEEWEAEGVVIQHVTDGLSVSLQLGSGYWLLYDPVSNEEIEAFKDLYNEVNGGGEETGEPAGE